MIEEKERWVQSERAFGVSILARKVYRCYDPEPTVLPMSFAVLLYLPVGIFSNTRQFG